MHKPLICDDIQANDGPDSYRLNRRAGFRDCGMLGVSHDDPLPAFVVVRAWEA
jgi:hypothetical protein